MLAEYEAGNTDHESHASLDPQLMRTAKIRGRLATSKIFMETAEASHVDGHITTIGTSPVKINRDAGVWYRRRWRDGSASVYRRHVTALFAPGYEAVVAGGGQGVLSRPGLESVCMFYPVHCTGRWRLLVASQPGRTSG